MKSVMSEKDNLLLPGPVNCHAHTSRSKDSQCGIRELCEEAVRQGMAGIAITDHCDIRYCRERDIYTPIGESVKDSRQMRREYRGKLKVFSGVEMGDIWYPEEAARLTGSFDFDIVLGSVHAVRFKTNLKSHGRIDFSQYTPAERKDYLRTYFDEVQRIAEEFDFDVLAHLTLPLRYLTGRYSLEIDLSEYQGQIDEILKTLIRKGKALEVNTSGWSEEQGFLMPDKPVLERYRALGGRLVTVGSDCHTSEQAAKGIRPACELLAELGYDALYYYEKRKPVAYRF